MIKQSEFIALSDFYPCGDEAILEICSTCKYEYSYKEGNICEYQSFMICEDEFPEEVWESENGDLSCEEYLVSDKFRAWLLDHGIKVDDRGYPQ